MDSARSLALELGIPERTVRRAAREGLIRGERLGARGFRTTLRERDYLRRHWGFLARLRQALRTEPNVRLAVLYGSTSTGTAGPDSDIDLLVELGREDASALAALAERLGSTVGRDVHPVRLRDLRSSPELASDVIEQGRVLVDRRSTSEPWQTIVERAVRTPGRPSLDELADDVEL